jgi:hypothetical protein
MRPGLTPQPPRPEDVPNGGPGWIVSENSGDDLYHHDTLAQAIYWADQAMVEGADRADVWRAVGEFSTAIDYDSTVEYSRDRKLEEEYGR